MNKIVVLWQISMFPYGIYRQWNCEHKPPFNLFGHRVLGSLGNGIVYVSPFGICKLFDLVNRLDIEYNKRDKTQYISPYFELFGKNYNTI